MNAKDLHYTMPAEWTAHERTFLSWPVQASMVYPEDYSAVSQGYEDLVHAIAEFEPVTVIVNPSDAEQVKARFTEDNVEFLVIAHNDAWFRDNGPTFLLNAQGQIAGVNWKFNAWGGKYSPWDLDDAVAPQVLEHYGIQRLDAPLVMEGGSIHVDGEGTLLTTEECLLNPNRNPELSRAQIEELVKNFVNVDKIIWLKRGLDGDETDGHVDNIACFAAPGRVILQVCHDPADENYEITQENLSILRQATDARGRALDIIQIEQPPKTFFGEQRLTLSYLNFYFVNGGIILPVFGGTAEAADREAVRVLGEAFPDRRIRTIDGMSIIKEGGNVHCTTQQMPASARVRA
ncbi:agmatine deiminase [Paenibacillus sp. UNCCL117]|uniref:agmatine deiminase family protein n=1 Tax=unclassified Paenibacillus TaxID=185978 RepID=UPI000889367C|nr:MULTISPECIES: agmatine deiminase family protein [unclassified Paenibacillus]SDC05489.1 agmatine deiminase [Paenibacillus sp. cl123]SFW37595.1 agmatine deiminase [Paenibacillus sp. UNCCL117]